MKSQQRPLFMISYLSVFNKSCMDLYPCKIQCCNSVSKITLIVHVIIILYFQNKFDQNSPQL